MQCLDSVRAYFEQQMLPPLREAANPDDVLAVISGSVSYGFSDEHSDVDVFLIGDLPGEVWTGKLRRHLFVHQAIDGFRVQFIPLGLGSGPYSPLAWVLREEYEKLRDCDPKLLFDILHYLPVHDARDLVAKSKEYLRSLGKGYWQGKCTQHCAEHIDVLEAFYGSLKRGNAITGSMYFGDAMRGLFQIAYLCAGSPYPPAKWLWTGLEKTDPEVFRHLRQTLDGGLPCSCGDMERTIRRATEVITDRLKEQGAVPSYIIDDLLSP